jgi:hypothetical protein
MKPKRVRLKRDVAGNLRGILRVGHEWDNIFKIKSKEIKLPL